MDDLNKKKPGKRQRAAVPNGVAVAADTAPPNTADGHRPDAALKPTADGAATLAHAASAGASAPPQSSAPFAATAKASGPATGTGAMQAAAKAAPAASAKAALQGAPQTPGAPDIVQPPVRKKGRVKSVRASFAVPKDDHATLDALKEACGANGVPAKKNQLLRVAIGLLREVEPARLAQLVAALPPAVRKKK